MPNAYPGSDNFPTSILVIDDGDKPKAAHLAPADEGNRDAVVYLYNRLLRDGNVSTQFDGPYTDRDQLPTESFSPGVGAGWVVVPHSLGGDFVATFPDGAADNNYLLHLDGLVKIEDGVKGRLIVVSNFDGNINDILETLTFFENNTGGTMLVPFALSVKRGADAAGAVGFTVEMKQDDGAGAFALTGFLRMNVIQILGAP